MLQLTIRDAKEVHVGDTITLVENPALEPLPGYKRKKACTLYRILSYRYLETMPNLKRA